MRRASRRDIVALTGRNQTMTIQALGYLGIGTDKLDDWTNYATNWLGMQAVDRGAGVRAFRMDDRKQRLVIDRSLAGRAALFRLGGGGRRGARCAGGAAGSGRRCGEARTGSARRSALRQRPDLVRRSVRQSAGGVPRRADRRRAVPPGPLDLRLPHRAAGHGPCGADGDRTSRRRWRSIATCSASASATSSASRSPRISCTPIRAITASRCSRRRTPACIT